jgi:hypothetical protein
MGRFKMEQTLPKAPASLVEPAEHASDCAIYNGPAYKAGPCDCGVTKVVAKSDHRPYDPHLEAMKEEVRRGPDFDGQRDALVEKVRIAREERRAKSASDDIVETVKAALAPAPQTIPAEQGVWVVSQLDEREKGVVHTSEVAAHQAAIDRAALNPGCTMIVMKAVAAYTTPKPTVSSVPVHRILGVI